MLMREPTITNKKGSEKGRTICKISPFTDPFYYYPLSNRSAQPPLLNTPNPAPCQNIHAHHNAEQRRGQEGKSARRGDGLRNSECFPFSQITAFQKAEPLS